MPSVSQLNHLQSIILKPLRTALGLHRSVHCDSVFVELNLPSIDNYRFALQVKALYRFSTLHQLNPVSRAFSSSLHICTTHLSSGLSHYTIIPWLYEVMKRLTFLNMFPLVNPARNLHLQLTRMQWWDCVRLRSSDHGAAALKLFHGFADPDSLCVKRLPAYLSSESRPAQVWRARLRFNAVVAAPTGRCVLCGSAYQSHRAHIILECPSLDGARVSFQLATNILGDILIEDVLEPRKADFTASSNFILAIASALKNIHRRPP
jgi:hypothetical protein